MLEFEVELSFDGGETAELVTVEITDYSPGCAGDYPGMGPPMSYASINAPEPEELEFRVLLGGEDVTDKVDDTDLEEIEKECFEAIERRRREEEFAAAENRMEV